MSFVAWTFDVSRITTRFSNHFFLVNKFDIVMLTSLPTRWCSRWKFLPKLIFSRSQISMTEITNSLDVFFFLLLQLHQLNEAVSVVSREKTFFWWHIITRNYFDFQLGIMGKCFPRVIRKRGEEGKGILFFLLLFFAWSKLSLRRKLIQSSGSNKCS